MNAVQRYSIAANAGKVSKAAELRKEAEELLFFDIARYQKFIDRRPMSSKAMNLDNCVWYLRSVGYEFTQMQEAVINKTRFKNFDKKLHKEYAQLLLDLDTWINGQYDSHQAARKREFGL